MATKVSKPLVCRLCGYGWTPRLTQRLPKCCPRCRSYAWQAKVGIASGPWAAVGAQHEAGPGAGPVEEGSRPPEEEQGHD